MGVMVNDGTGTNLCSSSQTVEEGLNWKLKADDGPALRAQDVEEYAERYFKFSLRGASSFPGPPGDPPVPYVRNYYIEFVTNKPSVK